MKRRIALLLSVFVVIVAVAVPCFAVDIDYNDYIVNENISANETEIFVEIPLDILSTIEWRVWDRTDNRWTLDSQYNGTGFSRVYDTNKSYALTCNPFRLDTLSVLDVPDGTVITFSYVISAGGYAGDSGIPARVSSNYYDSNGNVLGYVNGPFQYGQFLEDNTVEFTIDKPDGAVSISPAITFDNFTPIGSSSFSVQLTGIRFQFSIESLLRQQQLTGRTNKLLEKISKQFDDFLIGPDGIEIPIFDESMNNSIQAEQNILDRLPMQSVLEEFRNKESLVADGMQANINSFHLFTLLWEKFFAFCTWYEFLCYFALVVGSLMAFVGITSVFISRKGNGNE